MGSVAEWRGASLLASAEPYLSRLCSGEIQWSQTRTLVRSVTVRLPQASAASTPVVSFAFNDIQFIRPFLSDFSFHHKFYLLPAKIKLLF